MRRRMFLSVATAAVICSQGQARAAAGDAWQAWKEAFLSPSGRVVDTGQGGISHSEGQGYGLLLAQAFGDRDAFERIEAWTQGHLATREDALMSWKWDPKQTGHSIDWRSATDGDLFRAWAHLRAALQSGWATDPAMVPAIVRDLVGLCLAQDPRAPAQRLLRPGAEAQEDAARVLVNPSYYMTRAMRQLGGAYEAPALVRAADHGERLLATLAGSGFLPDWLTVTSQGFGNAPNHDDLSSYDALRIPLYLAWSGRRDHPALSLFARMFALAKLPGHVAVAIDRQGQVITQSNQPGFLAVAAIAQGSTPALAAQDMAAQPYYPATLQLLAHVAAQEGRA